MRKLHASLAAIVLAVAGAPAGATLPIPAMEAAPVEAPAFLFYAGASDIFEITSSMVALDKSDNAAVRAFATMLIDHHTQMTTSALATAKAAGVMPPPPEMTPDQKANIAQLQAATPAAFDALYLQQQVAAHQQALTLMQSYSQTGDTPALRQTAQSAIPTVQGHLVQAEQLGRR